MSKSKSTRKWYEFRFHKIRMSLAWLGGGFLFVSAHINDDSFRLGVPFLVLGMFLRLWASGYLAKKSQELASGGPFAHMRNPLYLANFLIGFGIVLIINNPLMIGVYLVGFAVMYHFTVLREETMLRAQLGEPYVQYCRAVPRYWPLWRPYKCGLKARFDWRLLIKHRELETFLGILLVVTGLYLWEEIVLEKQFYWKEKIAITIGLVFILGLILERISRCTQNSFDPRATRS